MVGHTQCQRAAGGTLAGDHGDDRYRQAAHLHQIPGNGLALPPLLGILAGVSARRVDKGDDGTAEFFSLLHQAQSLAVTLRPRHSKVAGQIFLQRGALAVADDSHRHPVETGHAAQNGRVLLALPVAALLKEIREQGRDRLVDVRTLRVTGQKDPILGSQRAAGAQNLVLFHRQFCQFGRMGGDGLHVTAAALQRGDLCVQRGQLLQNIFYHSCFPPA